MQEERIRRVVAITSHVSLKPFQAGILHKHSRLIISNLSADSTSTALYGHVTCPRMPNVTLHPAAVEMETQSHGDNAISYPTRYYETKSPNKSGMGTANIIYKSSFPSLPHPTTNLIINNGI